MNSGTTAAGGRLVGDRDHLPDAAMLEQILRPVLSDLSVAVRPWPQDATRSEVTFVSNEFADLLPRQRYHLLQHALPKGYYDRYLRNAVWVELTPNESPDALRANNLEDAFVESIAEPVLGILGKRKFADLLARRRGSECDRAFTHSRKALVDLGYDAREILEILHVFMLRGGFCDCEVQANVFGLAAPTLTQHKM